MCNFSIFSNNFISYNIKLNFCTADSLEKGGDIEILAAAILYQRKVLIYDAKHADGIKSKHWPLVIHPNIEAGHNDIVIARNFSDHYKSIHNTKNCRTTPAPGIASNPAMYGLDSFPKIYHQPPVDHVHINPSNTSNMDTNSAGMASPTYSTNAAYAPFTTGKSEHLDDASSTKKAPPTIAGTQDSRVNLKQGSRDHVSDLNKSSIKKMNEVRGKGARASNVGKRRQEVVSNGISDDETEQEESKIGGLKDEMDTIDKAMNEFAGGDIF